jgi:GNAT superfamily N-acetyltransferase
MFANFKLIRLTPDHIIKPFDCGDSDLNEFLLLYSHIFSKELFAVTYIIENDLKTVAFFSVLNDKISSENFVSKRKFQLTLRDHFPENKRFRSYPAVKIGRLGVDSEFQKCGLGTEILDYIKMLFVNNNRTGCRFITVDAYKQSLRFYEWNDFIYLDEKDKNDDTRLMYFDLSII